MNVKIKTNNQSLFKHCEDDVGYDLSANEAVVIKPKQRKLVSTGVYIDMRDSLMSDYLTIEAQIRPRSGLAHEYGMMIVNSPGTIDTSYTGELKVNLYNSGQQTIRISKGTRIAQLVFNLVPKIEFEFVSEFKELKESDRGERGHGSSGTF